MTPKSFSTGQTAEMICSILAGHTDCASRHAPQLQCKPLVSLPAFAFLAIAFIATAGAQTASPLIGGAWCGSVTATTATVSIRLNSAAQRTRLVVSTHPSLGSPIFSTVSNSNPNSGNTVKLTFQGLQPDTESAAKTRWGTAQKAWFKQGLIHARDGGFPMILWVNPDPWIDAAAVGADTWGGYSTERMELANFIRDNRVSNLVMLSADMQALAFDDGTHSDHATGGGAPIAVLHASALSQIGSTKAGVYSAGPLPGDQQYGVWGGGTPW